MATLFPTKRRSTLGRRHLRITAPLPSNSGENKLVTRPTLALPTPGRGLYARRNVTGQLNKSCKKTQTQKNLFENYVSTKKPQEPTFALSRSKFHFTSPTYSTGSFSGHSDSSLNLTGVQPITISPETSHNKLVTNFKFVDKLEPPKPLGLGEYEKLMKKRLDSIKPPIDPYDVADNIQTLNLNSQVDFGRNLHFKPIEDEKEATNYQRKIKVSPLFPSKITKTSPYLSTFTCNPFESKFSPQLSSTCVDKLVDNIVSYSLETKSESNCPKDSVKKLSTINENKESFDEENETNTSTNNNLNSTDSFLFAEQTIVDQDELFKVPTGKKSSKSSTNALEKTAEDEDELILKLLNRVDQVTTKLNDTVTELSTIYDQVTTKLNDTVTELSTIKSTLRQLVEKRNRRKEDNKENYPVNTSKKETKWISDLKTENPNLIKTPKPNRANVASRLTWTPHSLSMRLQDQVDDLFHD